MTGRHRPGSDGQHADRRRSTGDVILAASAALFTVASLVAMVVVVTDAPRTLPVLVVEIVTWVAATLAVAYVLWSRTSWGGGPGN